MPSRKACVLVVDHDADNREMLSEYLTFAGFDVVSASDGTDALARAAEVRPNVVVMEIALPSMDGLETTRRLRAYPVLKDTVVIATTAMLLSETQQKAADAGCRSLLIKPFDLKVLGAQIQELVTH